MASASVSAHTGQALSTVFGQQANASAEKVKINMPTDDYSNGGQVQSIHLLSILSNIVAVSLKSLGYLRGHVP